MALSDECYLSLVEAVKENSDDGLECAISVYSEIELLTSLVQCNEQGETLLATAMKMKNVSIIHELVLVLKKCDFTIKENQLKLSIAINQLSHQIPIMDILGYLLNDNCNLHITDNTNWLKFIAQVFIQSTSFTRQDKIIALEFTGASLITSYKDKYLSKFVEKSILALNWWREAMALRYFPAKGESLLPKAQNVCVPSVSYAAVFGSAAESTTKEELDLLQEDLERCSSYASVPSYASATLPCVKRMLIQALLVMRRIFTQANAGHLCWPYLKIFFVFEEFMSFHIQDRKLFLNIYLHILELMNGFDPKMLSFQSFSVIVKALKELASRFHDTIWNSSNEPESALTYYNLLVPTESIAMIFEFVRDRETIWSPDQLESPPDYFLLWKIIYVFFLVLNSIYPQLTKEEKQKLEEYYSKYIRDFFPEYPTTILHEALDFHITHSGHLEDFSISIETINLILELGADVNAIDVNGRTPLHILAESHQHHLENYLLAFQTLVDAGAHLYLANDNGETVISILKKNLMEYKKWGEIVDPYFESLINTVFPLSCYCARVIRRHRIPFEDHLPPRLQAFVLSRTVQHQWYKLYTNHHKFLFLNFFLLFRIHRLLPNGSILRFPVLIAFKMFCSWPRFPEILRI